MLKCSYKPKVIVLVTTTRVGKLVVEESVGASVFHEGVEAESARREICLAFETPRGVDSDTD